MTFRVVDTTTGKKPDLKQIALNEEWASRLMWCDMEGFCIEEDGTLTLMDECGNYAGVPEGRFRVEITLEPSDVVVVSNAVVK